MLTKNLVARLCKIFNLGAPVSDAQPIAGGLLHQVFYLRTSMDCYAIKLLNQSLVYTSAVLSNLVLTNEIAGYLAAKNIPAVVSLVGEQGIIAAIEQKKFMVFPWSKGEILTLQQIKLVQAKKIGEILAKIHQTDIHIDGCTVPSWHGFSKAHWEVLIEQTARKKFSFTNQLLEHLPSLINWSELAAQAMPLLNKHLIISHRDLDCKNVIWDNDNELAIIDWEYAGLINPSLDLLGVALNWSGQPEGDADLTLFKAVLAAYRTINHDSIVITEETIDGHLGYCLDWLEFNIRRGLTEPESKKLVEQEVLKSLQALNSIYKNKEKILSWL